MRMCLRCHDGVACEHKHERIILRAPGAGPTCGVCSSDLTEVECFSPVAREIDSYNRAVQHFALRMRAKFLANLKDKGGWQEIGYDYALKRLLHEAGELAETLMVFVKSQDLLSDIVDEAADVANFAVFIGSRAQNEHARDQSIQKQADEAWVRMRKGMGECYSTTGPCDRQLGLAPDAYCDVCKAALAKKDTQKLEAQ